MTLEERARGKLTERLKASVTYEYMPMKVRRHLSEAIAHIEALEDAMRAMVYETTHLSPCEPDGGHWCKISADALSDARAALKGQGR